MGGSIAGLLAAAALSPHFERVTVIERDELPDAPLPRKGVPQGNQVHVLLPIGERMIEELFPEIHADLLAAGCDEYDQAADVPALTRCGWRVRVELESARVVAFRRPLFELVVRRRLMELENVTVTQASVEGLVLDDDGANLAAVGLRGGDRVAGDLFVDASGRGSKTPKWLAQLGFAKPAEQQVRAFMGYTTQFVEVPGDVFVAGARGLAAMPLPSHPVGGLVMPADNGVAALAAVGMMKDYPPAERERMIEFLERARTPLLADIARQSVPVSEPRAYRQPGNLRRRWESLANRPGRFVVVGDAVASFNPVYGQGITMAAYAASSLRAVLGDPSIDLEALPQAFFDRLRKGVDIAFETAAGSDAEYEGAELQGFESSGAEQADYSARLEVLAVSDPEVAATLLEAFLGMRPDFLDDETIKAKATAVAGDETLAELDPSAYPEIVHCRQLTPAGFDGGGGIRTHETPDDA
ncbi:MAG TPA: FAD-dependent monooxygenase [Solirubrobacterales bacterium]